MRHYFLTAREVARLTRILEPGILREALGPPAIAAETDQALLKCGFVLAEGKLLPIAGARLRRRAAADAAHPAGRARPQSGTASARPPLADPERAPRHRTARRSQGGGAVHGPDVRQGAGPPPRQPASRRRALALDPERDRLPRPLHSGLGAHRRADAVRHLPRVHRRRAHDRGDPRAEHAGARRTGGGRAGRHQPGRSPAVAPRAVPGDAAARHRQGTRRRPFRARRRDRAEGRTGARAVGGRDRDGLVAGAAPSAAVSRSRSSATSTTRRPSSTSPTPSSHRSGCACCWC